MIIQFCGPSSCSMRCPWISDFRHYIPPYELMSFLVVVVYSLLDAAAKVAAMKWSRVEGEVTRQTPRGSDSAATPASAIFHHPYCTRFNFLPFLIYIIHPPCPSLQSPRAQVSLTVSCTLGPEADSQQPGLYTCWMTRIRRSEDTPYNICLLSFPNSGQRSVEESHGCKLPFSSPRESADSRSETLADPSSKELSSAHQPYAALLLSKIYHYIGHDDEAVEFALKAGPAFEKEAQSEYRDTIIGKLRQTRVGILLTGSWMSRYGHQADE
jgi:hypothetical protein